MSWATALVVLEPGRPNTGLLAFAADLATRMGLGLSGVAACQPMSIAYNDAMILGDYIQQDRDELDTEVAAARAEFLAVPGGAGRASEWHSMVTIGSPCDFTVGTARSADVILCAAGGDHVAIASRRVAVGDLVMQAGRPVLLVPTIVQTLSLAHAVVAWKDTREARRAVADALPLLARARKVTVVEIAAAEMQGDAARRLQAVVAWLGHHRIAASPVAVAAMGNDVDRLARFLDDEQADLVVAGAYGHSRLREWVLGGVTRDLFLAPTRCALVSH